MWFLETTTARRLQEIFAKEHTVTEEAVQVLTESKNINLIAERSIGTKTAVIEIDGILTRKPSFLAMLFGGGNLTYSDIDNALLAAQNDAMVSNIELIINSPGGEGDGLFSTLAVMQSISKPITAIVDTLAASAAYAIASQADIILAKTVGTRIGSVGVAVSYGVDDSVIDITSSNAPDKRPDVTTKAGKEVVIQHLDAVEELFLDAVATGRGVSVETVAKEFGRGAMFVASEAKKRGMIDGIVTQNVTVNNNKIEGRSMDLNTLKAEHPDVFAQAVELGARQELDRVCAHVTMGTESGDMQTAIEAIKNGSGMTLSLQAKYAAANMNKKSVQERVEDNPAAIETQKVAAKSDAEVVLTKMEELHNG